MRQTCDILRTCWCFFGQYNGIATYSQRKAESTERECHVRTGAKVNWQTLGLYDHIFVRDCGDSGGDDLISLESGQETGMYTVQQGSSITQAWGNKWAYKGLTNIFLYQRSNSANRWLMLSRFNDAPDSVDHI